MANEQSWNDKLELVSEYIRDNNKKPNKDQQLGRWLMQQENNFKKSQGFFNGETIIRKKWIDFIREHKTFFWDNEIFLDKSLDKIKKFIDINGRLPMSGNLWKYLQMVDRNYKKRAGCMNDKMNRKKWEIFFLENISGVLINEYSGDYLKIYNYEITDYPKIYNKVYWGFFQITSESDIIENRNNFVEKYNIKKCIEKRGRIFEKLERIVLKYEGEVRLDHLEYYMTEDKDFIVINSPYIQDACYDEYKWKEIYKLYSHSAKTYIKFISKYYEEI